MKSHLFFGFMFVLLAILIGTILAWQNIPSGEPYSISRAMSIAFLLMFFFFLFSGMSHLYDAGSDSRRFLSPEGMRPGTTYRLVATGVDNDGKGMWLVLKDKKGRMLGCEVPMQKIKAFTEYSHVVVAVLHGTGAELLPYNPSLDGGAATVAKT